MQLSINGLKESKYFENRIVSRKCKYYKNEYKVRMSSLYDYGFLTYNKKKQNKFCRKPVSCKFLHFTVFLCFSSVIHVYSCI